MIQQGVGYTFTSDRRGSSLLIDQPLPTESNPLTVSDDVDTNGQGVLRVKPGTVNNVMPTINGTRLDAATPPTLNLPFGSESEFMVVIKCTGEKNKRFPIAATVEIVTSIEATQDNDGYGYLAIASLTKVSSTAQGEPTIYSWNINQLVSGSVWAERRKLTEPDTAFYYFSRV
jgi:hypothetical protein